MFCESMIFIASPQLVQEVCKFTVLGKSAKGTLET
jgi:hypothetical protein